MTTADLRSRRIEVYDTTLRDGAQGEGVSFSLVDKLKIARQLDTLGVDYIEGGYPLSNPKDVAFFAEAAKVPFRHAQVCAFGMTRRKNSKAQDDPGMKALVASGAPVVTLVGKSWDLHVEQVLRVTEAENLAMIRESVAYCRGAGRRVFYDAEHFFDGYRAHAAYALATLRAAYEAGAERLILCDTNGGSLPAWITEVVKAVRAALKKQPQKYPPLLGIHTHNDSGLAVANTLAGVEAGAVQVQGTINGIGERCGNVDLIAVAANLRLKMGCACLAAGEGAGLARLTETSRFVYEVANLSLAPNQPYVGAAAFAHKGGMHVHAVQRVARSYEHVPPESVGNSRRILVSELSGVSAVSATLGAKFHIAEDKKVQKQLVERLAELENQGYQFEAAQASFELLLHGLLGTRPTFWKLDHYRCTILRRASQPPTTEASVKLSVGSGPGGAEHQVAEGDGPVNALDGALRKCLHGRYPQIEQVHLCDYKVRVVNATAATAAKVRVVAEFAVNADVVQVAPVNYFSTIGVSENVVDASWQALSDAFAYHLIECGAKP
jgi:2-isopropylmalate synthase